MPKDKPNYKKRRTGPIPAKSPADVFNYAVFLLSRRDYAEKELAALLPRKTDNEDWISATLIKLKEIDYINDKKFCTSYIRNSIETKGHGKRRITRELEIKGVNSDLISAYFEKKEGEINFNLKAKELLDRKIKEPITEEKARSKAQRFLMTRGFDFTAINYAINNHLKPEDELDY